MRRQRLLALTSLIGVVLLAACGATRPAVDPPANGTATAEARSFLPTPPPRASGVVVDLIDGDTLVMSLDGRETRIRFLLIDTPELNGNQCFSAAASAFVAAVAPPGSILEVEPDLTDTDAFGRLLRYVYLPDGSMLNEQLVRGGFARVDYVPPDQKYLERLRDAEDQARHDEVGLWAECETPAAVASVVATQTATAVPFVAASPVPTTPSTPTPTATAAPTSSPTVVPTPTPTPQPTATATAAPTPAPTAAPTAAPTSAPAPPAQNCHPSYPGVCIPPAPPDLDCGDIPFRRFQVLPPDPHRFDGDHDGIGCES